MPPVASQMKRLKAQKCKMIAKSVTDCDTNVLDDKELKGQNGPCNGYWIGERYESVISGFEEPSDSESGGSGEPSDWNGGL